jgi:CheY-like chemotaxis protein
MLVTVPTEPRQKRYSILDTIACRQIGGSGLDEEIGGMIRFHRPIADRRKAGLQPAAAGSADAPVPVAVPAQGAGETILVVEDDALVRGFVIAQLQSLNYRTVAAADGRAALEYVESGQPFDLLFTDVVMPGGMTGRQLADEVTKRQPGTKIHYTSGYTENAIVYQSRLDQGVMLLSKPYRKSVLAGIVRLALGHTNAKIPESGSSPLADTSIGVPTRQQPASVQALS